MKRLLTGALALLLSIAASATTLNPIQLLNPAGSTSGQAIVSTGASSAPAWSNIVATALASQAANTVVANVTASSASPTAFAMPSCSASGNNLQYTSGTGFTCATGYAQLASPTFTGTVTIPGGSITGTTISGSTGSFTTLAASSTVSGTGFTNLFAAPPAIGGTTPAAGKFTTLQATGTITPSSTSGIVGTTTNDSAQAGSIGEFICAQITNGGSPTGCATNSGTPVSLTTNTAANITSITLTAGDWDVWGNVGFLNPGSTVLNNVQCAASSTSATLPTAPFGGMYAFMSFGSLTGGAAILPCGQARFSLASTSTIFLVAQAGFTTSTLTGYGFIGARRRR